MTTKNSKALSGRDLNAAVLRFIGQEEPLVSTLGAFPQLDRTRLKRILARAAMLVGGGPMVEEVVAPIISRVRLYSDGAARGNPGLAGAGAVLVEPSGDRKSHV